LEQKILRDGYNAHLTKIVELEADANVELDSLEDERKILEESLKDLEIKEYPDAKKKFDDIYQNGPDGSPATKYLPANITRMFGLLQKMGDLSKVKLPTGITTIDPATGLDPVYKGYYDKLIALQNSLKD